MTDQTIVGIHAVTALLNNPGRVVKQVYLSTERNDQRLDNIVTLAEQRHLLVERLTPQKMNQRFPDLAHQGAIAIARPLPSYGEQDLEQLLGSLTKPAFILILDGVTDPHNLGACLRSADAAGVDFVIIPKDKNASITPVVSKVACGAAESMPLVRVTNLARAMEIIKQAGVWIYGAAGEASQTIYACDFKTSIAIALGAEGSGLRRLTRENCDHLFALPMLGTVESLNVSVATGISLYEVVRQR